MVYRKLICGVGSTTEGMVKFVKSVTTEFGFNNSRYNVKKANEINALGRYHNDVIRVVDWHLCRSGYTSHENKRQQITQVITSSSVVFREKLSRV